MPSLEGSKTHENLKEAFAGESQANRRYLYFARKADIEGYPEIAGLFRDVAEGETGHAFGHFDFLVEVVCRDNRHLLDFLSHRLAAVPGVRDSETFGYLAVLKESYRTSSSDGQ